MSSRVYNKDSTREGDSPLDLKSIKKITFTINTVILLLVFGLAVFFLVSGAEFLVWFSIPTALVYIIGYVLIHKNYLGGYVRLVYTWLTIYMCVTTICLGYKFGFHLYCLSMIPIIFYTEYMAEKLNGRNINTRFPCIAIVVCYLVSTGYTAYRGPIYDVDQRIAGFFWLFNSAIVLFFLIFYASLMKRMVGSYEVELEHIAHTDRLTGLFNRHYMMTKLEEAVKEGGNKYLAMADIDGFKQINDRYGHNAGDEVLKTVARIMNKVCSRGRISRWGGEEFLFLASGDAATDGVELVETLRKAIEKEEFVFEGQKVDVTITAGVAGLVEGFSADEWVKEADDKLYYGKNNGKNRVIHDIPDRQEVS